MAESRGSEFDGVESGFKRYPKYRDSGVEWLREIPEHWEVVELGRIGRLLKGRGGTKRDEEERGVPCIRYGDLYSHHNGFVHRARSCVSRDNAIDYTPIEYGDLLFAASGETLEEIGESAVNLMQSEAVCGGDIILFRSDRSVVPEFMGYAARAPHAVHQKSRMGRGFTVAHIYIAQLRGLRIPLPGLPEQRAVAAFLDLETDAIERLVRRKERLVELLREKRASVITSAVTKGPDPGVPMKASGIEWLGEIPVHWGVCRLKEFSEMQSGESITAASIETDGSYPVYGGNGLRGYTSDFTHEGVHLLVGRQGAHCGNVHTVNGRFWASEHAVVVRPGRPNVIGWLGALLEAMDLNRHSVAAAQPGLAVDRLRNLRVPVPPVVEQQAIADAVDRETEQIELLAAKVTKAIEHLSDYRTALISAAVTGRIDVR